MYDVVVEKQPVLSRILSKINNSSVNVQAYLLVGEDHEELERCALTFAKVLICPDKYSERCLKCNICSRIKSGNFAELKIIEPINGIIKKEEIINLRSFFQTKSIEGKNQIYIMKDVEFLNSSAANALLKFLEEPESNTVAIFTTTNLNSVINTIVSRCQIIKLNNNNIKKGLDFIKNMSGLDEDLINSTLDFLFTIESSNAKAFTMLKEFLNLFNTKELLKGALTVMLLSYKDALNYKIFKNMQYFNNETGIKNLCTYQNIDVLIKKISFILENVKKLEYNVNVTLFVSNIIIGIGEITDGQSNRS